MNNADKARAGGYEMGSFALSGGEPITPGVGRALPDFLPTDGVNGFGSTPYLHSTQQLEAQWYAEDHVGFDDETVTFMVTWLWMEPTSFTVKIDETGIVGWVQEEGKLL